MTYETEVNLFDLVVSNASQLYLDNDVIQLVDSETGEVTDIFYHVHIASRDALRSTLSDQGQNYEDVFNDRARRAQIFSDLVLGSSGRVSLSFLKDLDSSLIVGQNFLTEACVELISAGMLLKPEIRIENYTRQILESL